MRQQAKERFKKYLWLGFGIAIIVWFCISHHHHAEKERALRIAEAKATQSVSVLPEGVEETWLRYINERFFEEIQREDHHLKVRTTYIGVEPSYAYISFNQPYRIDCNTFDLGISVHFGEGDDESVAILSGSFSPDFKNEPKRGVSHYSIASKNLDEKLCNHIANQLAKLIGQ